MVLVPVAVAMFYQRSPEGDVTWLQQRTDGQLAGMWEFPGGKIEVNETPWQALVREIREETGVEVQGQGQLLGIFPYDYGPRRVLLHVFRVPWQPGLSSDPGKVVGIRPGSRGEEWGLPLLPANFRLVEHLCRSLYDSEE